MQSSIPHLEEAEVAVGEVAMTAATLRDPSRAAGRIRFEPLDGHGEISRQERGRQMKSAVTLAVCAATFVAAGVARAHHSFAMFDQEHPVEIAGTVVEFRYTSPHSFIVVEVAKPDGTSTVWNLEGPSPSILSRDGMSAKTIKPGDELILTIDPLRSGAPGGSWSLIKTRFKDGRPLAAP